LDSLTNAPPAIISGKASGARLVYGLAKQLDARSCVPAKNSSREPPNFIQSVEVRPSPPPGGQEIFSYVAQFTLVLFNFP
jgi:hypothetical protein